MESHTDEENLQQLIELCRVVFAHRHFEAAQHLLNAAIHLARDLEDEATLLLIQQIATQQYEWINANAPGSIMSERSAHARNGVDLYGVTIRQAAAHAAMVKENRRRRDKPPTQWE